MNIFHEIYSTYFRVASEILKLPHITEKSIHKMIEKESFRDSALFLPQKLIPQNDCSDWGLLKKDSSGGLVPIIKNKPIEILTEIQKQWIKSKLDDPKIKLFLENDTLVSLKKRLENVKPFYRSEHFRYTDRFSDGDDFRDELYQKNFRKILNALKSHEILEITFISGRNKRISGKYIPLKIQYSAKNDRFRLFCFSLKDGEVFHSGVINIGRIERIENTNENYEKDISTDEYFRKRKCINPVTICVTEERNAKERFFMEFAPYEKCTLSDSEDEKCIVKIWYDYQEETELLIRLLSFGPVIEILEPPEFRCQAKERIKRQYDLLNKNRRP
ncbi:MAG: WYL domain-containing protein [Ruminococcus sp.]|nr:WYL domain-containing protein [Ruminococcus sp.]